MLKEKELLEPETKPFNLELRILSGVALGFLTVLSILWVPPFFYILMLLIATGMLNEWYNMTRKSIIDLLVGLIIIPTPIISLLLVNNLYESKWVILTYFVVIWSVDTFAMVGGKKLKGPKLAPKISPNKTWSGLIVGIVSSACASVLVSTVPGFDISQCYLFDKTHLMLSSMLIAFIAQRSDLFISYFKRKFHIKDSGTVIPGHGGVLDRFDSIILTAPVLFLGVYCL
jgi:phosphatidate cytidylyltransferase